MFWVCTIDTTLIGTESFDKIKWLDVISRVDFLTLSLMYKIHNGMAPEYLCNLNRLNHSYATRYNDNAYVIPHCDSKGKCTFQYNGIILWNNLPSDIKQSESLSNFKKKCKLHLFSEMRRKESNMFSSST